MSLQLVDDFQNLGPQSHHQQKLRGLLELRAWGGVVGIKFYKIVTYRKKIF